MKLHPRHVPVEEARRELAEFVVAWQQRHGLTLAEELAIFAETLNGQLWLLVKHERSEAE